MMVISAYSWKQLSPYFGAQFWSPPSRRQLLSYLGTQCSALKFGLQWLELLFNEKPNLRFIFQNVDRWKWLPKIIRKHSFVVHVTIPRPTYLEKQRVFLISLPTARIFGRRLVAFRTFFFSPATLAFTVSNRLRPPRPVRSQPNQNANLVLGHFWWRRFLGHYSFWSLSHL